MGEPTLRRVHWLVSYPKSGNTWVRVLLANYLADAGEPVNINKLGGQWHAASRLLFDRHLGTEASDFTRAELTTFRPLVYEDFARSVDEDVFMKVHDAFGYTAAGAPIFPASVTASVVYIVRNPLDVAVSFSHHFRVTLEQVVEAMATPEFSFGVSDRGLRSWVPAVAEARRVGASPPPTPMRLQMNQQIDQVISSWSGHVESWLDGPMPAHLVRYEDLKDDTAANLGELVRALGLPVDADWISRAVEFSSLGRLQAQEREHGFSERPASGSPFFRTGRVGGWRDELPAALADRIVQDHADVMRRCGYLRDDGELLC